MSGQRNTNAIRGPKSALTDFLAAHNISAAQIRDDFARRTAASRSTAPTPDANSSRRNSSRAEVDDDEEAAQRAADTAIARSRKRRRDQEALQEEIVANIKSAKGKKKKGKKSKKGGSDDESDSDFDIGKVMYKKSVKLPGQRESCEICEKTFTVTAYNKAGPDGGLLCQPCGKSLEAENKNSTKKPRESNKKKRKIESNKMDRTAVVGTKNLQQLCIEKVAHHHTDVDDIGGLPDKMVERLSEIFSKNRILKSRTLDLFLRADSDELIIHDAAYLEPEDFKKIFAVMPHVKKLVLGNAGQFKDDAMEYMIEKALSLEHLHLHGSNLVTNAQWSEFFQKHGSKLQTLKLHWLDASFEDQQLHDVVRCCSNLTRLRLEMCRRLTSEGFAAISNLHKLEHLTLQLCPGQVVENATISNIISSIGRNLQTLCLDSFRDLDDSVIAEMGEHCTSLSKLRITNTDTLSDAALADLFSTWCNPPLRRVDFTAVRDVDKSNPDGPADGAIGFASAAFAALMQHSRSKLEVLNVASCRHISHAALLAAFASGATYPRLREMDLSFVKAADTAVLAAVFRACPALSRLVAFGCFGADDVVVPRGVVVVGLPRAQDAIERFGGGAGDGAVSAMLELMEESDIRPRNAEDAPPAHAGAARGRFFDPLADVSMAGAGEIEMAA